MKRKPAPQKSTHERARAKNPMGRPPLLPRKRKTLLAAVSVGMSLDRAALLAGIHHTSITNWRERADAGEPMYFEFFESVKKAEATLEKKLLANILKAGKIERHWTANMRLLESLLPEKYLRKESVDPQSQSILIAAIARLNNGGAFGPECAPNASRPGDSPSSFTRLVVERDASENGESH